MIADRVRQTLKPLAQFVNRKAPGKRVRWGSLRRREPLSDCFGWDRGLPIDRFHIERFLDENRNHIRGVAMEVRSPEYVERFGDDRVERVEVVDIVESNPRATLLADLCAPDSLPAGAFDSIVFTQTLHYLADDAAALGNLWRSLKPGGTMLITAPCITRVDNEAPESDYWRYTPLGLRRRIAEALPGDAEVSARGYGNVFGAAAFMMGAAVEEVDPELLEHDDPRFAQVSCAIVRRA